MKKFAMIRNLNWRVQRDSLADTDMKRVFGAHRLNLQTAIESYWNTDFGIHSARQKQQYGELRSRADLQVIPLL